MTHSRAVTIPGAGPYAGWDFVVSHIPHDVDRMEDLYTAALWPPDSDEPAHRFETYRYSYGWVALDATLAADDSHFDARLQTALDWWTEHHTSRPYEIHRILVAIDDTTWATSQEIAQRLMLDTDRLEPDTPYGDALETAARHGLVTWRNLRGDRPYAALTPDGYDLVHPDDRHAGDTAQQRLAAALAAADTSVAAPPPPAAGRAFPTLGTVGVGATLPANGQPPSHPPVHAGQLRVAR